VAPSVACNGNGANCGGVGGGGGGGPTKALLIRLAPQQTSPSKMPDGESKIIIGVIVASIVSVCLLVVMFIVYRRYKNSTKETKVYDLERFYGSNEITNHANSSDADSQAVDREELDFEVIISEGSSNSNDTNVTE
jgi:hypothetical protein